jgi:amidase
MMTTAGSLALEGGSPRGTHSSSNGCATAGAVLLGKTNLSEWANIRSTTFHERVERAGRAGPQSLRARPQSLRVEFRHRGRRSRPTWRRPPSGPKPTARSCARRPRTGSSASSRPSGWSAGPASFRSRRTQDTAGPMARTVADAAALLSAMAGVDRTRPGDVGVEGEAGRLLDGARCRRAERRAHRHFAGNTSATARRRCARGGRDPRDAGAGRRDRGSRRHRDSLRTRRL